MTLRVGIDIGGTFTDLVAIDGAGRVFTRKVLSTPADYAEGIGAALEALRTEASGAIAELLHATTIGSNTILEGTGARTALITTEGFRDVLEIRDLRMPRLYDLRWNKPPALVERRLRLEVRERTRPDGSIATPLDPASADTAITVLRGEQVQSLAVCLLHSYANPAHEQAIADAVRVALPDLPISLSHEILPEIKEYPRTSTTVINAYVQPVLRAYLTTLAARLRGLGIDATLHLMQSNGGLASRDFAARVPAHVIESGPAAGVVGAAALSRRIGETRLITFDMGGTTAKAGLVEDGEVARSEAMEVGAGVTAGARLLVGAGYMLKLPTIDLAEVGAGGGSICRLDAAGAPKVGPDSAGADPGPVCYGTGGTEPTITDCNLVLGYLDPAGLAGGAIPVQPDAARAAIATRLAEPMGLSVEQAAAGMLRVAAATMMRAIRAVTVERGRDPRAFALLAFGGNGPLFAVGIAAELGISRVIVPPLPGLFSAFGLLVAETEHHLGRSLRMPVSEADPARLDTVFTELISEAIAQLEAAGFPAARREIRRAVAARYMGQSSELKLTLPDGDGATILARLPALFGAEHARAYGFQAPPGEPVELIGVNVVARGLPERPRLPDAMPPRGSAAATSRRAWFDGLGWVETPVIDRAGLTRTRGGPLIIQEYDATCLVLPGTKAALDTFGNIRLTLGRAPAQTRESDA